MSYYTFAIEFWAALVLAMGTLPVVAVSARSVAGWFTHALPTAFHEAPPHTARSSASC
jgi:hypothetical protein